VLEKQRTQFQWASVSMIIVVVFLVVVLLDWVSSTARRRLVEAR
jgi:ABC-type phosphate/phosphonate transport system permease subunit